jgi:hypothetical protein
MSDVEYPDRAPKYLLGSFREGDFKNPASFIVKLRDGSDPLSAYLLTLFTPETQQLLAHYDGSAPVTKSLRRSITKELNELLGVNSIYEDERFSGVVLTDEIKSLIAQEPANEDLARLNRLLLEAAYPEDISKGHALGSSRADQIISLREDLSEANDRIEAEKKIVTDIYVQLEAEQKEIPKHGVVLGGYNKVYVDTVMKRLIQVARSRRNPGRKAGGD